MGEAPLAEPQESSQALRRDLMLRVAVATAALVAIGVAALVVLGPAKPGTDAPKPAVTASLGGVPDLSASVSREPASANTASAVPEESAGSAGVAGASPDAAAVVAAGSVQRQEAERAAPGTAPDAAQADEAAAAKDAEGGKNRARTAESTVPGETQAAPVASDAAAPDRAPAESARGETAAAKSASVARAGGGKPKRGPHLQAGVFLQPANAEALKATLEAEGVPVYIESRVQIGPFRDRKEAERVREKLKALGYSTVLVTQ